MSIGDLPSMLWSKATSKENAGRNGIFFSVYCDYCNFVHTIVTFITVKLDISTQCIHTMNNIGTSLMQFKPTGTQQLFK